ncbi:4701_t:CDS:2, partial [Gigaspora margarita]
TINATTQSEIKVNNTTIKAVNYKQCFRILGCYFTSGKGHKPILKAIQEEARTAATQLPGFQPIYSEISTLEDQDAALTNKFILEHSDYILP